MSPELVFELTLFSSNTLLKLGIGRLLFKKNSSVAGIALEATSGLPGYQYWQSWTLKGKGCIPPHDYTVSTQKLWMPNVKGVEGSFYAISPFSVNAGGGVQRGDFGIHYDANQPGSSGCIVIKKQDHWDLFRSMVEEARKAGTQAIPLTINYQKGD